MIIDSHCHLLHSKSEKMIPEIISDAKLNDVQALLNISTHPDEFDKILEFPLDKSFLNEEAEEKLEKLISRRERAGPVNLVAEKDASELENKINNIEEEKEEILDEINKLRTSIR